MMLALAVTLKKWMTRALESVLVLAVGLLVVDVVWGVFSRYALGEQTKWTEELARFLLVWVALLGGALAFGTKGHLGVDYFVGKFHASAQRLMAVAAHLFVLFFAGSIFLYGGTRIVSDALAMEQMTPALGWKMGHVYLALPIAGVFMVLFTVENLIKTLLAPESSFAEHHDAAEELV